jgi:transcriptional regulator with AAA-type ATPase domain
MTGLAARSERRELNEALGNIGELKNVIFHSVLEERHFTDVVNTSGEVAGNRNGCRGLDPTSSHCRPQLLASRYVCLRWRVR